MIPLGNTQESKPPADERSNGTSRGSPTREAVSFYGKNVSTDPAGDYQRTNGISKEAFSGQSRDSHSDLLGQESSLHREEGKRRFSSGCPEGGKSGADQIRESSQSEHSSRSQCKIINQEIEAAYDAYDVNDILEICGCYIDQLSSVNIAKACTFLAVMLTGSSSERLALMLKKLASKVVENISNFEAKELSDTALAFAMIDFLDEALFNALAREAKQKIKSFSTQDLANIARAFATFNIRNKEFVNLSK